MLEYLHLENVGPAPSMEMELAPRLNLLTGDNGLGKSFLLDCAWWALTQHWPQELNDNLTSGYRAMPRDRTKPARIGFRVQSKTKPVTYASTYSAKDEHWVGKRGRPVNPGLVIYAHADGGFAVWDPARNYWKKHPGKQVERVVPAYVFTAHEVWWGRKITTSSVTQTGFGGFREKQLSRGLVEDWALWIREKNALAGAMQGLLELLAAPDEKIVVAPKPQKLDLDDTRLIPALRTAYSSAVPIVHASAGMRRIMALAYMLLWSYDEHVNAAESLGEKPTLQVTMIFDEIEAHLHPRWQRSILRSVLDVALHLHPKATVQLIAATHSPLVLASAEPFFDARRDGWFDLDLNKESRIVELRNRPFVAHGDVSNWLASEAFDLKEARSLEAERAIEKARALLRQPKQTLKAANAITLELAAAGMPDIDPFWVRWGSFVERLGGKI